MEALRRLSRQEFFARPTAGQIRADRTPVTVLNFNDLFNALMGFQAGSYLAIRFPMLPDSTPGGIPYEDSVNFRKRGPLIVVHSPQSVRAAVPEAEDLEARVEEEKRPLDRKREAFRAALTDDNPHPFVGYVWPGLIGGDRVRRIFLPTWDFEAAKFLAWDHAACSPADKIEFRPYETTAEAANVGGKYMGRVPSRRYNTKYEITLEFVPTGNGVRQYAAVWNLKAVHDCPIMRTGFSFRYRGGQHLMDPHIGALYERIAAADWREGEPLPMELLPFTVPSRFAAESVSNVLTYAAIVQLPNQRTRPLLDAERNVAIFEVAKRLKDAYDDLFFATEKVWDYDWLKHRPAMNGTPQRR